MKFENIFKSNLALLMSLPIFKTWTKWSLFRILYYFSSIKYKMDQIVFKEGESAEKIYFVKMGEFEVDLIRVFHL